MTGWCGPAGRDDVRDGLIWGVWHWPLPWVGYFGSGGTASDAVVAMLLWLPLSVLLEFVIGWLWSRSRSVWPPAILHGGSNLVVAVGLERFVARVVTRVPLPS